jgi:hypothetical protein
MKAKTLYLLLCVLGTALPYWQFIPWVVAHHGVPIPFFINELFSTRIGSFFGMDVLVSAIVLIVFGRVEASRLEIKHRWLAAPALVLVGVSLAFPLFLYLREASLERRGSLSPVSESD